MFPAAACLLAGSLLFQNPAPAPSPPPHPSDERKPAVALDPELRRAIDALRATNGMRFEAVVNAHAPQPRAIAAGTRETPQREPDVGDDVRLTAVAQRDRPMHVEHERVDAWRQGERLARPRLRGWRLFVLKRGRPSTARPRGRIPPPCATARTSCCAWWRSSRRRASCSTNQGRITSYVKVTPRERGRDGLRVRARARRPRRLFVAGGGDSLRVSADHRLPRKSVSTSQIATSLWSTPPCANRKINVDDGIDCIT
jgi:hypothetical protein